MAVVS